MPVIIPMIVPVQSKVNCIVQNNITYCEKAKDLSTHEIGVLLGVVVAIMLYIAASFWLASCVDFDDAPKVVFGMFLLPFVLGMLLCMLV